MYISKPLVTLTPMHINNAIITHIFIVITLIHMYINKPLVILIHIDPTQMLYLMYII